MVELRLPWSTPQNVCYRTDRDQCLEFQHLQLNYNNVSEGAFAGGKQTISSIGRLKECDIDGSLLLQVVATIDARRTE